MPEQPDAGRADRLERLFKVRERGSTPRREGMAGLVTFLAMAYIIFVNPSILAEAGMDRQAVIGATILASAFGTLLVGLWANVPIAMAPGMGLNAFFAYTLVKGQGIAWETALGVVFVSGAIFLLLTLTGVRTLVTRAIPMPLRIAIAGAIGLFITFIGFQNLGLIVSDPVTLVTLGEFSPTLAVGLAGLLVIVVLEVRKIRGAMLIGIAMATVLALLGGLVEWPEKYVSAPPSLGPVFLQMDLAAALRWGMWSAVFSFMFVDLFDSVGTIVACAFQAGLVKEDGSIAKMGPILSSDAIATVVGAALGTSTTTCYIESGAGIAEGGRTGLANVVTAALFLAALFFTPLIGLVPTYATAPALVVVGIYMFRNVSEIDFSDMAIAVPAFLLLILMPLTYSISLAMCFGFISYVLCMAAAGKARQVHPFMWVVAALAVLDLTLQMG